MARSLISTLPESERQTDSTEIEVTSILSQRSSLNAFRDEALVAGNCFPTPGPAIPSHFAVGTLGSHEKRSPSAAMRPTPGKGKCGVNTSSLSVASFFKVSMRFFSPPFSSLSNPISHSGFTSEMIELCTVSPMSSSFTLAGYDFIADMAWCVAL